MQTYGLAKIPQYAIMRISIYENTITTRDDSTTKKYNVQDMKAEK